MIEVELPDGSIAEFPAGTAPDVIKGALQKRFGAPQAPAADTFADRFHFETPKPQEPQGPVQTALNPLTSYPATQQQMAGQSYDMMAGGAQQAAGALSAPPAEPQMDPSGRWDASRGGSLVDAITGAGKAALGGLGYVTSPITAGLRTILGKPVEDVTGIPKEYTEFAASMALPIPKSIPGFSGAAKAPAQQAPTVEALKQSYKAAKESPEVAAVSIKPEALVRFSDEVGPKLNAEWLDPNLAPKTFSVLDRLTKVPEGGTVTMANVDSARRLLGKMAGRGDEEAAAAQIAKKELDKWVMKIKPDDVVSGDPAAAQKIMQEGRADYTAGKLGEALDSRLAKAEAQADASHSGMNLQNQLRQKVNQFLNSGESRALSAAERAELEGFVKGTISENAMRYAGKFLGGGGGLGALTASGVGGLAAGPAGLAAPVVGYALTKISNSITARHAEKLSEMIRSRSPLAERMTGPLEDYGKAVQAFETSPNARNMSRAVIASRNLSHNLKDAGINVSPNDLLRSIQGPVPGRAQDEQK